ncbi:50S ribosomal protein L5 [Candidatus Pacearchaeota archaeon]|nr:50S ribosomal protein L5 [Candidatus Pacearchaeota archaeon]
MRKIRIEKVLISCGAIEKNLEKSKKLLELISGMKAQITVSKKRIPNFGVTPDLEVGARVTLRGEKARQILSRLLTAINNTVEESQVTENHFSFGIREYIEIQGIEYQRDVC